MSIYMRLCIHVHVLYLNVKLRHLIVKSAYASIRMSRRYLLYLKAMQRLCGYVFASYRMGKRNLARFSFLRYLGLRFLILARKGKQSNIVTHFETPTARNRL